MLDLVIIGGGITGAAAFAAAARHGISVLLLEQKCAGSATTAVTSGLFHGGLRYLPFDVATSYSMCRETERLLAEQPGLLKRDAFLWPIYKHHRFGKVLVESLMEYYDRFAPMRKSPGHVRLNRADTLEVMPGLQPRNLGGAVAFDEYRVDVPALMNGLIQAGRQAGGAVTEGRKVSAFVKKDGRIVAAKAVGPPGHATEFLGRVFLNAGGPWAEEIATMAGVDSVKLSLRRGVHLVVPGKPPHCGLIFPEPNGRYIGLFPKDGEYWVGPTDDPHEGGPEDLQVTPEETDRLSRSLKTVLPDESLAQARSVIGMRPIFRQYGMGAMLSRDYRVIDHEDDGAENLVTVTGGKLTSHQPMAEDIVDVVLGKLGKTLPDRPEARSEPFPFNMMDTHSRLLSLTLSGGMMGWHLLRRFLYGRSGKKGLEAFDKAFS